MKAFRSTVILLLIAAGVGAYIYFNERGPVAEPGSTVLARLEPDQVASIRLQQPDGQTLLLQKEDAGWSIQRGTGAKVAADPDVVQHLLAQLQLVQSSVILPDGADKLKEYGLDKPNAVLSAGDTTIEFGKKPGFDPSAIYVRAGDKVALLPTALSDAVARPLDAWRDKAVLRVVAEDVKKLQITAPAIAATFEKVEATEDAWRSWQITSPVQATADLGVMNSFLYTVFMSRAAPSSGSTPTGASGGVKTTKFLADNPKSLAPWGLDKPTATLSVTTDTRTVSLLIGRKVSDGYAAKNSLSPAVFVLPEMPFGLINRPLRAWRSKSILNLDIDGMTNVEIAARGALRRFKQEDGEWIPAEQSTQAAPSPFTTGRDAISAAVLDALRTAQELNALNFIDNPGPLIQYGLDKPALRLAGLEIGTKNGKVYARSNAGSAQGGTVYVLPPDTLDKFKRALDILFQPPKSDTKKDEK